jgi:anaerobic selenocysteine-containing dehydrogenase
MSTERIVAHEPVARNLVAAMNSNGFRLSLISPRRTRTNHRNDADLDRFGQVLPGGSDLG